MLRLHHRQLLLNIEQVFENKYDAQSEAGLVGGGAGGKVVDEAGILEKFQPGPIADELIAMLYTETIKMIPMFSCLQNEVIAQLCLRLQNMPALKGSPVTVEGNVGKCMCA